ncbi:response regulator receiver protein [Bradyrhizobium sp. CCBAU 53415]|uniref:response regulator receiver protein n=1 Tax=Bradyrhizobium sp. CCBAU 53415 TaxID=1325119 RepID=UPI0023050810|nr:response regulator receiver protein [Bradyrhizobium sp. CCBAU 53415]MDA9464491.1 hypothetical protein [Bradyrhizobium sp. CCBAU 53415]
MGLAEPESGTVPQRRVDVFVQPAKASDSKPEGVDIPAALSSIAELLKAIVPVAILILIVWNWAFFATWLNSITHGELPGGWKFDRAAAAEKLAELDKQRGLQGQGLQVHREFDFRFANGALVRAERVYPALAGARVLWVDGRPSNNRLEEGILRDMGIDLQIALNTGEAINLARKYDFDLVISNLIREHDTSVPLDRCGAFYFAFPNEELSQKFANDLGRFNAQTKESPPAGFAMAEKFAQEFPNRFGDTQLPRIIFYTASSGGIATSRCGRIVTNRPDVLLQSVVSALEEFRWDRLVSPKSQKSAAAQ